MSVDESEKPEEPSQEDCCQNGCTPCVFDIYKKQLKLWEEKRKCNNVTRNDVLSETRFKPFILSSVKQLTDNTNLYKFKPSVDSEGILPYNVGQHLILKLNNESKTITRAYTIITGEEEREHCTFQVLIKLYNGGLMSNYIKTLNEGDITYWRGPYGDFIYKANHCRNILMICIGTGIAPMYAIIQNIINNENDETMIQLMYGSRCPSEIILRQELYKLSNYWNFNYKCYLSQNYSLNDKQFLENFIIGKINKEHIKTAIKCPVESLQVLVCGNSNFTKETFDNLIDCDVLSSNIHVF